MKRIYTLILATILLVGIIPMMSCEEGQTGAPKNFAITASSDGSKVVLTWDEPTEGVPDEYVIYFDEGGTGTFDTVATTTDLEYTHDPAGKTGKYKVAAKLGDNEYDSDVLSTIPVNTPAKSLSELNASGNSGYGWGRDNGTGETYSMDLSSSATSVDFYLTDFAAGWTGTWRISSPDMGPGSADSTVIEPGAWRANGISDPITDPQAPLPEYIEGTTYFNYTDLTTDPQYLAVRTADGYFALIKCSGKNASAGTINIETWFQSVKGLRLIAH